MTVNISWFTLGGIYRSDDQDPKRPSALILPEIEVYPGGENMSSYYPRQLRVLITSMGGVIHVLQVVEPLHHPQNQVTGDEDSISRSVVRVLCYNHSIKLF